VTYLVKYQRVHRLGGAIARAIDISRKGKWNKRLISYNGRTGATYSRLITSRSKRDTSVRDVVHYNPRIFTAGAQIISFIFVLLKNKTQDK